MRQALALTIAVMFAVGQMPSLNAQLQGTGIVTGTVSGPQGALAGITVQAVDLTGAVAATTVTTETGVFSMSGLSPGTFTVQAIGANGAVVGTSTAALSAGAMTAAVSVSATAGTLAATAAAAAATAAGGAAVSTGVVLAAVGSAAAGLSTLAVISTGEEVSGSR